jgi:hypothetical protein
MAIGARNMPADRALTLAHGVSKSGIGHVTRAARLAPSRLGGTRQDGRNAPSPERGPVIRVAAVMAVGYVLGAKAGRRRYEQLAGTFRAVTGSPATKAVLDAGRRKIADRVSPDRAMVTLTPIDARTSVLQPEAKER